MANALANLIRGLVSSSGTGEEMRMAEPVKFERRIIAALEGSEGEMARLLRLESIRREIEHALSRDRLISREKHDPAA